MLQIDPKRAIPRLEHHRTQKLFVGGLPPSVTTESMREFFMQYGKVVDATVMVDRDSSRSKGFGFVTFEDASGVEKLLGLGNLEIDGKMVRGSSRSSRPSFWRWPVNFLKIEVKLAQPRGARRDDFGNPTTGTNFSAGGGYTNRAGGDIPQGAATGNMATPFDPQAMANLYQRMFQLAQGGGGGAANPGWAGGNMMAGGMGGMPGMANPMMMNPMMGAGMGRGMMNMGMGGMMGGMGPGMGGGRGQNMGGMGMGGGMGGNIPPGPRAMRGTPQMPGQQAPPSGSTGPTRFGTKGQHSYRPY
jgi:RNA-binding protein Musashi